MFQRISKKNLCKDFRRTIWGEGCKYSSECKQEGYLPVRFSNLCSGIEMTPRPSKPSPMPPVDKDLICYK